MRPKLCLAVVLFMACVMESQQSYSSVDKDNYFWMRTLSSGRTIKQAASSVDSGPRVFINSLDRRLFKDGLTPSRSILDFSTDPCISVVKLGWRCYQVPCNENYTEVVQDLTSRNGTTVTASLTEVLLNATDSGSRLTKTEKRALFASNPQIFKICKLYRNPLFEAVPADSASFPAAGSEDRCERVLSTVTYNSLVRILTRVRYRWGCHH